MDLHELRKEIDELIFKVEERQKGEVPNREYPRCLALVRTKLQEAKMWAGMTLGSTGSTLPKEHRDFCDDREKQTESQE